MTLTVFFGVLLMLSHAMERGVTRLVFFAFFRDDTVLSVYLTASTGDILLTRRQGLIQLIHTVISVNSPPPMNMSGLTEITCSFAREVVDRTTGVTKTETMYPKIKPMGVPTIPRSNACLRTSFFSWRLVVPIVFKSP